MPTHWKKMTNPDYLGSYAFDPNEEKTATIDFVRTESVAGTDGKREDCIVCHFRERDLKPLILNRTNCKAITKLYKTPYIENWAGKRVTMVVRQVKAFGDVVDAVRIKPVIPRDTNAKSIPCESCGKPIAAVGQYRPEDIARINKERYGMALCTECSRKMKDAQNQPQEAAQEPPADETKEQTPSVADALRASMEG